MKLVKILTSSFLENCIGVSSMKKIILVIGLLVGSIYGFESIVDADSLLTSPYVISKDINNVPSKEIPTNLINMEYVGEDIRKDLFLNGQAYPYINVRKHVYANDTLIIKNMGTYKNDTVDLSITFLTKAYLEITSNGTVKIRQLPLGENGVIKHIKMTVYKHNTTIVYPNVYIGYNDQIFGTVLNRPYGYGDSFGLDDLYGIYLPEKVGSLLTKIDVQELSDNLLFLSTDAGTTVHPTESVYPIFKNTNNGFSRGRHISEGVNIIVNLVLFEPTTTISPPVTVPYKETSNLSSEQETTDIHSLDVKYTVTQKLAAYSEDWQYPNDNTFKIKTNFEQTNLEDYPVDVVVKLENNKIIDKKNYSSLAVKNSHELTFSSTFLKNYKGLTIKIEYSQHLDGEKGNLFDYYNFDENAFVFSYRSENSWERQGAVFKQEMPSTGQIKVKFGINLSGTLQDRKKVIQNKSTDDYNPLDFISDLSSNIPNDTVKASFTKKVVFENRGEQEILITLTSTLSSATKDIVLKVEVIEGTIHFTEAPSGIRFPPITLTGKVEDYEVESFNEGILSVLDDRLTKSPWSLTAVLTENKTMNKFEDILYFRNEEGDVYNITNQSQNVITNRDLNLTKTIIDYEKNKKIGLFMRINPLFVKKGEYEGSVTWSLVDAPG